MSWSTGIYTAVPAVDVHVAIDDLGCPPYTPDSRDDEATQIRVGASLTGQFHAAQRAAHELADTLIEHAVNSGISEHLGLSVSLSGHHDIFPPRPGWAAPMITVSVNTRVLE